MSGRETGLPGLSVSRCRALLDPDCDLTDKEVELLRDSLTTIAHILVETWYEKAQGDRQRA